jgi:hypothetical protein
MGNEPRNAIEEFFGNPSLSKKVGVNVDNHGYTSLKINERYA